MFEPQTVANFCTPTPSLGRRVITLNDGDPLNQSLRKFVGTLHLPADKVVTLKQK